jgi:PRTRC genetic system protein F
MNSGLQLPILSASIPHAIIPRSGTRRGARLARCLLDAGVIHGSVSARRALNPLTTAQAYLQTWLGERLGRLKCLQPGFRLQLGSRDACFGRHEEAAEDEAWITWFAECSAFSVGEALERLEDVLPGLGVAVLSAIDATNWNLLPTFTPRDALGTAQDYYWYGEADEGVALDEQCGDDKAAREAMRQDMVTREKIDAAFPAWAVHWHRSRKGVSRRELQRVATEARSARVRGAAADALALLRLELDDRFRPDADGWFVGYGAVLTWAPGDITVRIFDDFANDAVQGDYCDWMGEHSFGLDTPQAVIDWMAAMEIRFEGMRRLDSLIHNLSTGDWRHVPKGFR